MNTEKISKILGQIEEEIKDIRKEIGNPKNSKGENPTKENSKLKRKNKSVDLLQPIRALYNDNFFANHKADLDVKEKLELDLLTDKTPKRASIVNVLRKMVKDGLLIREKIKKDKKTTFCYKNKK